MDADGEKDRPALGEFCQCLPFDTEENFIGRVFIGQFRIQSFSWKSIGLEKAWVIIQSPVKAPDFLS